jgi:hypothetical protein
MASKSIFPAISMNDFTSFARKAKFVDKNLSSSTLDRLFIAANVEVGEEQDDNPDKALIRFEFIELLARVAIEKYKKPGIASSATEAF